ncbi:MAG: YcxB family protein [Oscillospiraceae bacterium]|jgi:hypothetical protein|nr:YcxB family protein [Oscillospiraceae bacterium]
MAFENVPAVKVRSGGLSYLFGDYFAVYQQGFEFPKIYNWADLETVTEYRESYVVTTKIRTEDSRVKTDETFTIKKDDFKNLPDFLAARAILEGAIAENPGIVFKHQKRILPTKNKYKIIDIPHDAFVTHGVYNDREINYSNVVLVNTLLGRIFIIAGVIIGVLAAVALMFVFKPTILLKFPLYYSVLVGFSGLTGGVVVYLVGNMFAKSKYTTLLKSDPALGEDITHVVCNEGFGSVETCIYTGSHLLPWDDVRHFIETNYAYIITSNNEPVFWLPKRLFDKKTQAEVGLFIQRRITEGRVDRATLGKTLKAK